VREGLRGVLRAVVARQIAMVFLLALAYVVGLLVGLHAVDLWTSALAKDSVLWFLFSGPFFAMSVVASRSGQFSGAGLARGAVSATIVVEYVASSYTFPLPVELVLVPSLTVIALLSAVAETRDEFIPARKLFGGLTAVAGFLVFAFSIRMAVADFASFGAADTWRAIALAPVLSLLFVPFVYCLALYSSYETLFLRLKFSTGEDD
jgi:hypothetical protein